MTEKAGAHARNPSRIPEAGWRDILRRVIQRFRRENMQVVSAAVAFYAVLSAFPAAAFVLSLYALLTSPADMRHRVTALGDMLPSRALAEVLDQLSGIAQAGVVYLGASAVAGLALSFWSATRAIKVVFVALNQIHREKESRSWWRINAMAVLLTAGVAVEAMLALGLGVVPASVWLHEPGSIRLAYRLVRWPLLALLMTIGLAVIYRVGPSRMPLRWAWVSPGALIATGLWLAATALFSLYVANFARYNEAYGAVGSVIVLLLWFLLGAHAILLGALINAEADAQAHDDRDAPASVSS